VRIVRVRKALVEISEALPRVTDSNEPYCQYAIAFDLSIPGWLPPSFDGEMSSTSFGVIAMGKIGWSAAPAPLDESSFPPVQPLSTSYASKASVPIPIAQVHQAQHGRFGSRITRSLVNAIASTSSALSQSLGLVNNVRSEWQPITVERHRVPPATASLPRLVSMPEGLAAVAEPVDSSNMRHFTLKPSGELPAIPFEVSDVVLGN
jgi:hypothetical protein